MPIYRVGGNLYAVVQRWGQITGWVINTAGFGANTNNAIPSESYPGTYIPQFRRLSYAPAETAPVTQEGFRWRNDDGSETTATWKAAQDTNATLAVGTTARLRVLLDPPGNPEPIPYTLRYKSVVSQKIAVPSYFWVTWYNPVEGNHDWERMQASTPTQEIAICNPSSGPGTFNADWVTQITAAKAAGLKILGYVRTQYTVKTAAAAKAEVDLYYSWYGVDGIFFDECSWEDFNQPYYLDLFNYVKAKTGVRLVVLNPGIQAFHESYMQACNIVMNYEGYAADYLAAVFPSWINNYPPNRFWHAIHDVTGGAQRQTLLAQSLINRAGYVYLTTDTYDPDGNPYNTIPPEPYWAEFVTAVATSVPNPEWLPVPVGTSGDSPVYIAASANITASGQVTTAQLAAPSGKTTALFSAGRMWDDENGTDTVDI